MAAKAQMARSHVTQGSSESGHPAHSSRARRLMWLWFTILLFLALLVFTPKAGGFGSTTAQAESAVVAG